LGDGFVEAIADQTLVDLSKQQCKSSYGKICGQILYVPSWKAPGQMGVGRFGWKDQHASLLCSPATRISTKWASPTACSPMSLQYLQHCLGTQ